MQFELKKSEEHKIRNVINPKYSLFFKWIKTKLRFDATFESLRYTFIKVNNRTKPVPSIKTIYNWYHCGLIGYNVASFVVKRYRKKVRGKSIDGHKSIHKRALIYNFDMNDYSKSGHYEIDTIYNGNKKGGVLTFTHRATMTIYSKIIPDRKATTINKTLRIIISIIGAHNILSITSDNGLEFAYSKVIEKSFDLLWFYCDPYKSGQRGQNERLNREIRIYYKKINDKPRRKFNGLSSIEYTLQQKLTI